MSAPPQAAGVAQWAARARTAGHPVLEVRPGRFAPRPVPARVAGMAPNDVLDIERETARARVDWVHVLMPTSGDLLTLAEAIRPPSAPPARPGMWGRLLGQPTPRRRPAPRGAGPVGPLALSETRGGLTAHVLEIPVSWLAEPVTVVRRPPRRPDPTADTGRTAVVVTG